MSRPDSTAAAALDEQVIKPIWLGFLDFLNEPIRANTSGASIAFSGTGNPDLDGNTFDGISASLVDISPIAISEDGTESVTATLSASFDLDDDMLAEIADDDNWQGRICQLWRIIRNAADVQQGGVQHYYTGYMTNLDVLSSPGSQTITVTIEGYVSYHSPASFRSYMDQSRYDPGDESAGAAIAVANGNGASPATRGTPGGGSGHRTPFMPRNLDQ